MKSDIKSEVKPERVVFYPDPAILLYPFILSILIALFVVVPGSQSHKSDGHVPTIALYGLAFLGVLSVIGTLYGLFFQRGRVDTQGIWWRNRRGKRLTRWDEITDFYQTDFHQTIGSDFVVKTEHDTITLGSDLVHAERLRDLILTHCGARLELAEWGFYGLRPRDFPQVYDYPEKSNARNFRLGRAQLFPAFALLGGLPVTHCLVAVPVGLVMTDFALLGLALLLGLNGLCLVRTAIAARGRSEQKFIAQTEGFTFDSGREAVFVAWGDVIGYDFNPKTKNNQASLCPPLDVLRLRTAWGQEFHFLGAIDRVELWKETVRRLATNGIETKIDAERAQALGSVEHCWSGGVEGVGDRVFHARTRDNLTPPIAFGFFALIPVALTTCDLLGWISLPITAVIVPPLFALGVEAALIANYFTRRVTLGSDGISYTGAGRRMQHIPWRNVAAWKNDFHGIRIDSTDGTHLRFKPTELAFGSRIVGLIEEHLRDTSAKQRGDSPAALSSAADR